MEAEMTWARWALMLTVVGVLGACAGASPSVTRSHDPVTVEHTDLLQLEGFPVQVVLRVEGQLPDPCHEAVWTVSAPDTDGRIEVELHSEAPQGLDCIQVLQPMTLHIPIGSFERGSYSIWLNGNRVGALDL